MTRLHLVLAVLLALADSVRASESTTQTAFDDFLIVPLRAHFLSSSQSADLGTTLQRADLIRILGKVNRVWSHGGLHFYLESLQENEEIDAPVPEGHVGVEAWWLVRHLPEDRRGEGMLNAYFIKRFGPNGIFFPRAIVVKDTASLRAVEGGIDEPIPRVLSHEIGHAFGLPHRQDTFNLMASGTTGTQLNEAEIATVRAAAKSKGWIVSAADVLRKADSAYDRGELSEARTLYRTIKDLAVDDSRLERVRTRVAE